VSGEAMARGDTGTRTGRAGDAPRSGRQAGDPGSAAPRAARPDLYAAEADLYDLTVAPAVADDIDFYAHLAGAADSLLELACGTGRVLVPCAEAAGEAWGVDSSPSMLAHARERARAAGLAAQVHLVEADMRSARLGRAFPLVTIPFRSLFHLRDDDDWMAVLATVHAHLEPGGLLAADVFVPDPADLAAGETMRFTGEYALPGGDRVAVWDHWSFDAAAQLARRRRVTERLDPDGLVLERRHRLLDVHYRWPGEVMRLLELGGFEVTQRFGGFDGRPFGADADQLIVLAQPA
jgi:SAM-dependent methyltransferase